MDMVARAVKESGMHEIRSSDVIGAHSSPATIPGLDVTLAHLQPGLMLSLTSSRGEGEVRAAAVMDTASIHCSCLFGGSVGVSFSGRDVRLNTGTLLMSYAPGERFAMHLPRDHRNVELMVTPETLSTLSGVDYDHRGSVPGHDFCVFGNACGRRARDAAARLARLMGDERSPRLLIHAAALEFLAWSLDAYQSGQSSATEEACSIRDRKRLVVARERLLQDLSDPPTIAELARETGLNQLKLKRGFKAMFGHSVYALFQRERMDRARQLLQRHGVAETAMMVGYSNASHFSAAFRKQFGVLPREARRGVLE